MGYPPFFWALTHTHTNKQVEVFDLLYEIDGKSGDALIEALEKGPLQEAWPGRGFARCFTPEKS